MLVPHRCKKCLWWDREHQSLETVPGHLGYCRKHAPLIYQREGRYYGGWPLVDAEDLCGEFREEAK